MWWVVLPSKEVVANCRNLSYQTNHSTVISWHILQQFCAQCAGFDLWIQSVDQIIYFIKKRWLERTKSIKIFKKWLLLFVGISLFVGIRRNFTTESVVYIHIYYILFNWKYSRGDLWDSITLQGTSQRCRTERPNISELGWPHRPWRYAAWK